MVSSRGIGHAWWRVMADGLTRTVKDTHVRRAQITIYGIMNAVDNDSSTDMHTYDAKKLQRLMQLLMFFYL